MLLKHFVYRNDDSEDRFHPSFIDKLSNIMSWADMASVEDIDQSLHQVWWKLGAVKAVWPTWGYWSLGEGDRRGPTGQGLYKISTSILSMGCTERSLKITPFL